MKDEDSFYLNIAEMIMLIDIGELFLIFVGMIILFIRGIGK